MAMLAGMATCRTCEWPTARAADDWPSGCQAREIVLRRGADGLNLLDLVVEIGQVELERRGRPRTWYWPSDGAEG